MLHIMYVFFLRMPFFLHYADTYPVLLPVLLCAYKKFRLPREVKLIFWLVLICGFINLVANLKSERFFGQDPNNLWMYHLYAVVSFILTSWYFIFISTNAKLRRAILIIMILFTVFSVINILEWQGLNEFDSNGFTIASFVFIIYSILFYYGQLKNAEILFIERSPNFWIVTGIFFYYAGCFFLFLVYYNIGTKNFRELPLPGGAWTIQQIMFIVLMLCFSIGISLCKPEKQISAA